MVLANEMSEVIGGGASSKGSLKFRGWVGRGVVKTQVISFPILLFCYLKNYVTMRKRPKNLALKSMLHQHASEFLTKREK